MAFLGDLVVRIGGNAQPLAKEFRKTESLTKSFASSAASMINPITAGLAALTAGAASAGVAIYMVAGRIANLAKAVDEATKIGVSGAFFQKLGYAADQSGVSVDTLTGAMKKLTVTIGKGDDKPFSALGISVAELKALNPEQQFMRIATEMSKLPTAAERAAAAVKIFGKSGVDMTGLFAGGLNDINRLMQDAQDLGIGINAAGLAKAAEADDAIQRMKASFGALLDQITVGLAPTFKAVADYITEWIPPITKFFAKFNELDDKVQWMSDVFSAGLDVGFEQIKVSWQSLLNDMTVMGAKAAFNIAKKFTLVGQGEAALNLIRGAAGAIKAPENKGLENANKNFANVLGQLGPDDQGLIRGKLPVMGGKPKAPAADGSKLSALAGGLAESAKGLFDQAALAAQSKLTDLKIKGGFLGSIVENMFTGGPGGDKEKAKAKDTSVQLAGAMQKGSQEAYSTIVRSLFRGKDPNVQATEKQTGVLAKAIKANKPQEFTMIGAFA